MPQLITKETVIPISLVCVLGYGVFYVSEANSKIENNLFRIQKNEARMEDHTIDANKNLLEIIQRLTRIEEAVKNDKHDR